jgi:hypothetical protein
VARPCHHHDNDDLAIALGITGLIVGTAIAAEALTRPRQVVAQIPACDPAACGRSVAVWSDEDDDAFARCYDAGAASVRPPAQDLRRGRS